MLEFKEIPSKVGKAVKRFVNPPHLPTVRRELERKARGDLTMQDLSEKRAADQRAEEMQFGGPFNSLSSLTEGVNPVVLEEFQNRSRAIEKRHVSEFAQGIQKESREEIEKDDRRKE